MSWLLKHRLSYLDLLLLILAQFMFIWLGLMFGLGFLVLGAAISATLESMWKEKQRDPG